MVAINLAMARLLLILLSFVFSARLVHSTAKTLPLLVSKGDNKTNPLLLDWDILPFDLIRPEHLVPGIKSILQTLERELSELENNVEPEWSKLVRPLEKINDRYEDISSLVIVYRETAVQEYKNASDEADQILTNFKSRMDLSKLIYGAFKAIRDSPSWPTLSEARQRVVEDWLSGSRKKGIELKKEDQEKLKAMDKELESLIVQFAKNVEADGLFIPESLFCYPDDLNTIKALPEKREDMAAALNKIKGHGNSTAEEILCVSEPKTNFEFLELACNRSLREEAYRGKIQRSASSEYNNTAIIERILDIRFQQAQMVGYKNFSELVLGKQIAPIRTLLEKLQKFKLDVTTQDIENLRSFARSLNGTEADSLKLWDVEYFKWMQNAIDANYIDELEEVLEYFSLENVLDSIHGVIKKNFDVTVEAADGLAPIWHKDVRFFSLKDSSLSNLIGYLYLDVYKREGKPTRVYTVELLVRSPQFAHNGASTRLPVFMIGANFRTPTGDKPCLLTFYQIQSLFHEYGHALQGILTKQDETLVAGIRGLDNSEFIGMFMANWPFQRDIIKGIAKHYKTREPLSDELLDKYMETRRKDLLDSKLRLVDASMIDLELNTVWRPNGAESIFDIYQRVSRKTTTMPPLPEDKLICRANQMFTRVYYASRMNDYLVSDLLGSHAFQEFVNAGLDNEKALKEVGAKFRDTFLADGGGKSMDQLFIDFRGSKVSYEDYECMFRVKGMQLPAKK